MDENDHKVPTQADGTSPLEILGQAKFTAIRDKVTFFFEGYVVKKLNAGILCGAPFMERNKLVQELHNKRVVVDGKHVFLENSPFCPNLIPEVSVKHVESVNANLFRETLATNTSSTDETQTNVGPASTEPDLHLIEIGPQVPKEIREKLHSIHEANKDVFNDDLSLGYNGELGDFEVNFNFTGGVPPTPNYYNAPPYNLGKDDILMQAKIDSLEL